MRSLIALRFASKVVQRTLLATAAVSPSASLSARCAVQTARALSSSARCLSAVSSELCEALKNEINAEKQLESDNLGGAVVPTIPGFDVVTKDAEVRLSKTNGNEKILVVFNVSHSVDMEEFEEDVEQQQQQEAPVPVALPPFSIEITKGNERLCFNLELVRSVDEEGQYDFRVEEFYVAPAAKGEDEAVADSVYASSGKYIDPNLHELLFMRFLEERGFDAKFCQNLVNFATHHEHSQYVSLLGKIKTFVGRK